VLIHNLRDLRGHASLSAQSRIRQTGDHDSFPIAPFHMVRVLFSQSRFLCFTVPVHGLLAAYFSLLLCSALSWRAPPPQLFWWQSHPRYNQRCTTGSSLTSDSSPPLDTKCHSSSTPLKQFSSFSCSALSWCSSPPPAPRMAAPPGGRRMPSFRTLAPSCPVTRGATLRLPDQGVTLTLCKVRLLGGKGAAFFFRSIIEL
jgi:hypothetical protein